MWMSQKVQGRLASASMMPAHQANSQPHPQASPVRQGWIALAQSVKSRTRLGMWGVSESCDTLPFGSCAREQLQQQQLVLSNWPAELKAKSLFLSSSM